MDRRADAFLALPGGIGTLEELIEVWVARTLGMHAKPVVFLGPDGLFQPLRDQLDRLVEEGFVRGEALAELRWAATVDESMALIEQGWREPAPKPSAAAVTEAMLEAAL